MTSAGTFDGQYAGGGVSGEPDLVGLLREALVSVLEHRQPSIAALFAADQAPDAGNTREVLRYLQAIGIKTRACARWSAPRSSPRGASTS